MVHKVIKRFVMFFTISFCIFVYLIINLTISQVYKSEGLIYKYGRVCGRGSLKSFQDESDMSKYSTSTGAMSPNYDEYLRWLSTKSDYSNIVSYLRSNFSDGVTPTNFSIPYVDEDQLEGIFNQQLNLYMEILEDKSNLLMYSVDNIKGKVKSVSKEFQNFNTHGMMYGNNSSFKDNISGHTMLYDYNSYVSYYVVFEVEYDLLLKVTDYFNITRGGKTNRSIEIPVRYELYN